MKKELQSFGFNLYQEIDGILNSLEDSGGTPEGIFTDFCLSLLEESELTESSFSCYDEKLSKRGIEHKINGYALHENYETLDLFITDYDHSSDTKTFHQKDFDQCLSRIKKFFQNVIYNEYLQEIDEMHDVYELLRTLKKSDEVKENLSRINFFIITNKVYDKEYNSEEKVAGFSAKINLFDLSNLYKIQTHEREPIVIDFTGYDQKVYCVNPEVDNQYYYSVLTAIPGNIVWDMYHEHTSRLLEQNVRSFLQFTGKINKGIKNTITHEPQMFMAFNNGISGTANNIEFANDEKGLFIKKIYDFQIVNGGQTTASIYHTRNKDKRLALDQIHVPTKINIIKNISDFESIVSRIAEYSNTQNKVSVADLSSNKENHIAIEELSRNIWAPPKAGTTIHTRWFYERSRGQYRNEKHRNSSTPKTKRQFDLQNPRNQLLTKESLAKYYNSFYLKWNGKKPLIGPHIVVKGAQKNYLYFLKDNFNFTPNKTWWEDAVAVSILFKTAEQIYGVKPNALGDLRFAVVPYSISYISWITKGKLNLESIWKSQTIDESLQNILRDLMIQIEHKIKSNASGSLYAEYAKKQECWDMLISSPPLIDSNSVSQFVFSKSQYDQRQAKKRKKDDVNEEDLSDELEIIKSYKPQSWVEFGKIIQELENIPQSNYRAAIKISSELKLNKILSSQLIKQGIGVLDIVSEYSPESYNNLNSTDEKGKITSKNVTINASILKQMSDYASGTRILSQRQLGLLFEIAHGMKPLNEYNLKFSEDMLKSLIDGGFAPKD